MKGIFKVISYSEDAKTILVKFSRLNSQTPIDDCAAYNLSYSNYEISNIETFSSDLMRKSGETMIETAEENLSIISENTPVSISGSFSMDDIVGKVIQGDINRSIKETLSVRKVEL
tara:strand:+ start:2410 stop:2757 length:348 start_codon:yes stop_codon:yes gene_type:complete